MAYTLNDSLLNLDLPIKMPNFSSSYLIDFVYINNVVLNISTPRIVELFNTPCVFLILRTDI